MEHRRPILTQGNVARLIAEEVSRSSRVLLVASGTLARAGDMAPLVEACAPAATVLHAGVRPHAPRSDVAEIAAALLAHNADIVVAVGGGSVIDATKAARLCAANGVTSAEGMDALLPRRGATGIVMPRLRPPLARSIAVPTTLSAAEYTAMAGVTRAAGDHKQAFSHPELVPDLVVLDGDLAALTPLRLWCATGARALDHAIETWCSMNATPETDGLALDALRLLWPALKDSVSGRDGPAARLAALRGAGFAIGGLTRGAVFGASHGIGHALGSVTGMGHGETSAVMLPHVLAFNGEVNGERQRMLAELLGEEEALADIVRLRMGALGLPTRLRDAGLDRAALGRVAEVAIRDRWVKTNPRKISQQEIATLLHAAW